MGKGRTRFERRLDEELGITIYADDAPGIETVGGLQSLVLARIAARNSHPWLTLKVFRDLRAETREILGKPNLRLRPSDRVIDIVPWTRRRAFWRKLQARFQVLGIWDLQRPAIVWCLLVALTLGGMRLLYLQIIDPGFPKDFTLLALVVTCLFPFIVAFLSRPMKIVPPVELATFGDIVLRQISLTAATKAPPENPVEVVNQIIVDEWKVPREELKPTARLFMGGDGML